MSQHGDPLESGDAGECAPAWDVLLAEPQRFVVGLDFDGTLAPIVDDPTAAHIHPDAPALMAAVAARTGGLAVVTGRPVRQALALGELEEVGALVERSGGRFAVLGQYGNERWDAHTRRLTTPLPPRGLATFLAELPVLLRHADAADAFVESKGLAVAVHTRRMPDSLAVYARLEEPLTAAAKAHGLTVEPGRQVIEVRAPGMDKGVALRRLVTEWDAASVLYAGDDLGDVEAFLALRDLRSGDGFDARVVAAHTGDGPAQLLDLADHRVDGPAGVVAMLRDLLARLDELGAA
ncbi:trehalose-phosphatase [Nocardioides yefusunii]|uniref:Trehalose 6-phosphate phosphatase n=1 Tax=Nocardioides yefusunii TaxID=2500546 RepID=A0ABW1R0S3_9ACTN|nr:trehalose-phosphatase [Nocardioides yefusunii]